MVAIYNIKLKPLVLTALLKKEMTGYSLMSHIEKISGKRPSSGSMYPLLEELTSKKTLKVKTINRKKLYSLTEQGKKETKLMLKNSENIEQTVKSIMNTFCAISSPSEIKKLREILSKINDDKLPFNEIKKEMLELKSEIIRILKNNNNQKTLKAKKIMNDATEQLRRI